jgi:KUP system potassium uptake protein
MESDAARAELPRDSYLDGAQDSQVADRRHLLQASIAALGVVFGDIGTSPLYAVRECLHGPHAVAPTPEHVLGVLSLVFWALAVVISVKYLAYVLRADNRGEGGVLALSALASRVTAGSPGWHRVTILVGLFGAALLYGDGMITPAISVLSAVEGLRIAAPKLSPFVVPLTVAILVGLFSIQRRGTARIGALFGPIMLVWFATLALLGIAQIVQRPGILAAINPAHMVRFLAEGGSGGFLVLGSVFLVVTGGEALYADMGHFGARPIRRTWFAIVLPALLLNYFGQGALVLGDPLAASSPFYRMAPSWALPGLIALSTFATVIASQALISGAFSLTRQAIMLGYWPRLRVIHTSAKEIGQIYVPGVNWVLMLASCGLVIGFGSSSRMAAAYGIAVNLDMIITTVLAFFVARRLWGWRLSASLGVTVTFLAIDLTFLGANSLKLLDGGWFPLVVGGGVLTLLTTWKSGRALLGARFRERMLPLDSFLARLASEKTPRVPGTAVYMSGASAGTPPALLTNFAHNHVVHEHVILLTILTEEIARVPRSERLQVEILDHGFSRVVARYGFMQDPNVPRLLAAGRVPGYQPETTTYFLGRETVIPTKHPGMALWREKLFAFMARNAQSATALFKLPPDRVIEIGAQIEI